VLWLQDANVFEDAMIIAAYIITSGLYCVSLSLLGPCISIAEVALGAFLLEVGNQIL
jgi:hypothetical protein